MRIAGKNPVTLEMLSQANDTINISGKIHQHIAALIGEARKTRTVRDALIPYISTTSAMFKARDKLESVLSEPDYETLLTKAGHAHDAANFMFDCIDNDNDLMEALKKYTPIKRVPPRPL